MLLVTKRKDGVDIRTSIVIPIELWRRARAVTGPKELRKVILEGLEKRVAELEAVAAQPVSDSPATTEG